DTLTATTLRDDLPSFGVGSAMLLLAFGALASMVLRRSRPFFFFGLFALAAGSMILLEVQDFFSLYAVAAIRDPIHEATIYLVGTGFAGFIAEVFPGRWARLMRAVAIS